MSVALVFPGQGSQRRGMFAAFDGDEAAERTFEAAARILGYDPRERDDEASLRSTVHAQIGLFLCGVASARALQSRDAHVTIVAGHSVGAFSAAVACESLSFDDALRAIVVRARTMERLFPAGYGMGVCAGIAQTAVRTIVEGIRASGGTLYVANVNAPAQIAISGSLDAIDEALDRCRRSGARRAERLAVAVPSHCPLMQPAAAAVRRQLQNAIVETPRIGYVSAMRAALVRDAAGVIDDLSDGVAHEVRWDAAARLLEELGTKLAIEAVPGRVLTDLWEAPGALRPHAMDGARLDSSAALARRYACEPT